MKQSKAKKKAQKKEAEQKIKSCPENTAVKKIEGDPAQLEVIDDGNKHEDEIDS